MENCDYQKTFHRQYLEQTTNRHILQSLSMKLVNFRTITRARTNEEKARRHIYGDVGATFSKGKYMVLSGQVQGCITSFPSKDCLCAEIYETEYAPVIREVVMTPVDVMSAAKRSRNYWANGFQMNLEIGDRTSNSITQNIDHHLALILYEK